ncbi:hypothetical protein KBW81_07375 [Loktanella salsilacus]|uniref:hypothetical protein n=1 Tax=Loktanella salsilacus TaxID=195913 RepID=UPI0020B670C8|nr:hypothetical protein [Loktanella salsilacus]UTH49563.1 hypothetical protein KBW81_07375 [Loktanella salsilacus]
MYKKIDQIARARKNQRITYTGLTDMLGLHHRSARWFLGLMQAWLRENGYPHLQALVFAKHTGVPGEGYVASARGGKPYDQALQKVWNFTWPKNPPF